VVQTPPDIKRQRRVEVRHQGRQRRVEVEHQGRQHRVEVLDLLLEAIHPAELRLRVDHLDLHILLLAEAAALAEVPVQVAVVALLALHLRAEAVEVTLEGEEDSFFNLLEVYLPNT
jgi:N-dimethylarginine dimethylaminohydrolase